MEKLQIESEIVKLKAQIRFLQEQLNPNDTDKMETINIWNCVEVIYKNEKYRRFEGNHVYWERQCVGKHDTILWEELDEDTEIMLENEYCVVDS